MEANRNQSDNDENIDEQETEFSDINLSPTSEKRRRFQARRRPQGDGQENSSIDKEENELKKVCKATLGLIAHQRK